MHILSPETDNCPSWISGRERMTVVNISWSISMKECCWPRRGLNPRPPGLQSDAHPTEPPRPAHVWWMHKHHSYGLWVSMTQSWSDFTLTFTFVFLLEVITWLSFILGSWICYATYPDLNLHLCARVAPGSCPRVRLGSECITGQIKHLGKNCYHMGKDQWAGTFVYFGHVYFFFFF